MTTETKPKYALTYDDVKAMRPCADGLRAATKAFGGIDAWKSNPKGIRDWIDAKIDFDDILWVYCRDDVVDAKTLRLFAADCAQSVLHLFEDKHPEDKRPREAIEAARKYAHGEITQAELAAARAAAWAAASAAWPVERDAARAATWAAAWDAAEVAAEVAVRAAAWAAAWADILELLAKRLETTT